MERETRDERKKKQIPEYNSIKYTKHTWYMHQKFTWHVETIQWLTWQIRNKFQIHTCTKNIGSWHLSPNTHTLFVVVVIYSFIHSPNLPDEIQIGVKFTSRIMLLIEHFIESHSISRKCGVWTTVIFNFRLVNFIERRAPKNRRNNQNLHAHFHAWNNLRKYLIFTLHITNIDPISNLLERFEIDREKSLNKHRFIFLSVFTFVKCEICSTFRK